MRKPLKYIVDSSSQAAIPDTFGNGQFFEQLPHALDELRSGSDTDTRQRVRFSRHCVAVEPCVLMAAVVNLVQENRIVLLEVVTKN